jgi:uncharacterized protein YcfJ
MKFFLAFVIGFLLYQPVHAQQFAEVIRIEPRIVTIQQQHCQDVVVRSNNSGVGTVIGGVAGGIAGNQIGGGSGKDVATIAGVIIGGMVGNRIGQDQANYQTRRQCTISPVQVQRGKIVTFRYNGRLFIQTFD